MERLTICCLLLKQARHHITMSTRLKLTTARNRGKDLMVIIILIIVALDILNFDATYLHPREESNEITFESISFFFKVGIIITCLLLLIPLLGPQPLYEKDTRAEIKSTAKATRK